jgi:hypothetical protein
MASISPRVAADITTELAPEERIRAIANKVRRPPGFAAAQQAYRDLSERHTALRDEERRLIAQMLAEGGETANGSATLVRRIREVDLELSALSDSIRAALENVFQARQPFTKAVTEALQPERTAAARRALRASLALIDEFGVLDMIDREIASVFPSGNARAPARRACGPARACREHRIPAHDLAFQPILGRRSGRAD